MGDLAGLLTAAGGAIAAILGAFALVLRQQRINGRSTRREVDLLWQISTLEIRRSRILRLALERAGINLPPELDTLEQQIRAKRDELNADLLVEQQRQVSNQ